MYTEKLKAMYEKIQAESKELNAKQSSIDLKLGDLYHYIELGKYNAVEGSKLLKCLKGVLCERRDVKDRLAEIQRLEAKMTFVKKLKTDVEKVYSYRTGVIGETFGKNVGKTIQQ